MPNSLYTALALRNALPADASTADSDMWDTLRSLRGMSDLLYNPGATIAPGGALSGVTPTEAGNRLIAGKTVGDIKKAKEAVQDLATLPGNVYSGAQPIYDENGNYAPSLYDRSARAALTLANLGLGSHALSGGTIDPATLNVFAGPNAKTANLEALKTAAHLVDNGLAYPDDAWRSTGWFTGKDNMARFEIPDDPAVLKMSSAALNKLGPQRLGDILDHPDLYAAYPELADIMVSSTGTGKQGAAGQYMPSVNPGIFSNVPEGRKAAIGVDVMHDYDLMKVLLHETQHAIQQREGFATGTNPKAATPFYDAPAVQEIGDQVNYINDQLNKSINKNGISAPETQVLLAQHNLALDDYHARAAWEGYRRAAGETEATNVENRWDNLSKDVYPEYTELYPRSEQTTSHYHKDLEGPLNVKVVHPVAQQILDMLEAK